MRDEPEIQQSRGIASALLRRCLDNPAADTPRLIKSVIKLYRQLGFREPSVEIHDSPMSMYARVVSLQQYEGARPHLLSRIPVRVLEMSRRRVAPSLSQAFEEIRPITQQHHYLKAELTSELEGSHEYFANFRPDIKGLPVCFDELTLWYAQKLGPLICAREIEGHAAFQDAKFEAELRLWQEIIENCFALWFSQDVVLVCKMPTNVQFDEQMRLHNPHGLPVLFMDGYELRFWRGRYIPKRVSLAAPIGADTACGGLARLGIEPLDDLEPAREHWSRVFRENRRSRKDLIRHAVRILYRKAGLPEPDIRFHQSLIGKAPILTTPCLNEYFGALMNSDDCTCRMPITASVQWLRTIDSAVGRLVGRMVFQQQNYLWTESLSQCLTATAEELNTLVCCCSNIGPAHRVLLEESLAFSFSFEACDIFLRPTERHYDENGRYHSSTGPALVFEDGTVDYLIHGVRIPRHYIDNPETLTPERIESEQNVEVRSALIRLYGEAKFVLDAGGKCIDKSEYGSLYRKEVEGLEPMVFVCVINSTEEPDGSRKTYFLRVPPEMRTAREAVAWTFQMNDNQYSPDKQT